MTNKSVFRHLNSKAIVTVKAIIINTINIITPSFLYAIKIRLYARNTPQTHRQKHTNPPKKNNPNPMSTTPEMPSSGLVVVDNSGNAEHGHVRLQQQQQQQVLVSSEDYSSNANETTTTLLTTAAGHYITSSGEIISNGQFLKFVSEEEATLLEQQHHHNHQHHHTSSDESPQQMHHPQTHLISSGAPMSSQPLPPPPHGPKVQLVNNVVHMSKPQPQQSAQTISFVQTTNKSGNSFTYITTNPSKSPTAGAWTAQQPKHNASTAAAAAATTTLVNKMMNGSGSIVAGASASAYKALGAMLPPASTQVTHALKAPAAATTTATPSAAAAVVASTIGKALTAHQRAMANRQTTASPMPPGGTIHLNATGSRTLGGAPVMLTTANNQQQHIRGVQQPPQAAVPIVMQPPALPAPQPTKSATISPQGGGAKAVRGATAVKTAATIAGQSPFKINAAAAAPTGRGEWTDGGALNVMDA